MKIARALTLILALVLVSGCKRKDNYTLEKRPTGYKGEARYNPFLAAQFFLEKRGYETDRERGRAKMPGYQTISLPQPWQRGVLATRSWRPACSTAVPFAG